MVIAFIEGSLLSAADIEDRLLRKLRPIVRKEERLTCLFAYDTAFLRCAEWAVRKLRTAYPEKEILSVGVFNRKDMMEKSFKVRYTSKLLLPAEENVRYWMAGRADVVVTFMDPLLCVNRECMALYRQSVKTNICINLCNRKDMDEVREKIPLLPKWERRALTGKLHGEPKATVAQELGISRTTLKTYEVEGAYRIARTLCPEKTPGRRCAVFGFSSRGLSVERQKVLWEILDYLQHGCGITTFLVSSFSMLQNFAFASLITEFCRCRTGFVHLVKLSDSDAGLSLAAQKDRGSLGARILAERRALTDSADIVLCDLQREYRSGLRYARRKKVPVINLNEIGKVEDVVYVREQIESIQ